MLTIAKNITPGITIKLASVRCATEPIVSVKTMAAVKSLVGGQIEVASDYTDDCCADITTNPLVTAVKLCHDQHRKLVLSPDIIWLTICQGIATHIEENWSELKQVAVADRDTLPQMLDVSTEEFPYGSPESPWGELIAECADRAYAQVTDAISSLFVADFSTTTHVDRVAMSVTFLSAVNNHFSLYDVSGICGIPSITLLGTPDDWAKIQVRVAKLDQWGLSWWMERLQPICNEFVSASKGHANIEFWNRICTDIGRSCGDDRITGWIGHLFPYLRWSYNEAKKNPTVLGTDGEPPTLDYFPIGLRSVSMRSQRGSVVRMLGGLVGISQNTESLELRPKTGWAVQRATPFDEQLEELKRLNLCHWKPQSTGGRFDTGIRSEQITKFYQSFESLSIFTDSGEQICEFLPLSQIGEIRTRPPVFQIAKLFGDKWLAAVEVYDFEASWGGKSCLTAFFIGKKNPMTRGGKAEFIGVDFASILSAIVDCARAEQKTLSIKPIKVIDPQDYKYLAKYCWKHYWKT